MIGRSYVERYGLEWIEWIEVSVDMYREGVKAGFESGKGLKGFHLWKFR